MADLRQIFIDRARAKCPSIIFPEAENEIISKAAVQAAEGGGFANPFWWAMKRPSRALLMMQM